ncbi:MAG: NnrU family protein [Rhizobiales bacterium]|nr:NnrU family protein [Hyphomicrobiales bacterium]
MFTTARGARAALLARMGEGAYKGLYSVIAFAGVLLIAYGFARYRANEWINVWLPPVWTRHIAVALVFPAIICIVAAYIPGNIKRVLKHPMLVGVKLWAVAHLIANGDIGSIILFGSILAWAVYDRIALKRRPEAPSRVPYGGWASDGITVVIGTFLYLALALLFHPIVIGVSVFGAGA